MCCLCRIFDAYARPIERSGYFFYSKYNKKQNLIWEEKIMKKMNKFVTLCAAAVLSVGMFTGCGGGSASGEDKTYTVSYDNSMDADVLASIPEYQFVADNMNYMVAYGLNLDVTLDLDKDGTYTLTSKYYNQDPNCVEGDPGYADIHVEATGTYTKDGDKVTISAAEEATAVYQGGAYIVEQGMFDPFSFNGDGTTGEWSSSDAPDVLECVPETVFTVTDDGAIVTWEAAGTAKGNPHASATAESAASSDADGDEVNAEDETEATNGAEATYVMAASDTDSIYMTFAEDGTCRFEFTDYQIAEDCTWEYADGVLTVTNPNGDTATSEMDGDVMKLTYVAAASDQLVGNLEASDWAEFFK
jgi:hypothetical protein